MSALLKLRIGWKLFRHFWRLSMETLRLKNHGNLLCRCTLPNAPTRIWFSKALVNSELSSRRATP